MATMASHVVLLNAHAGTNSDRSSESLIRGYFDERGICADIRVLGKDEDIVATTKRAIAGNARVVVAGGGDGTVNAIAGAVIGSGATLGVLPLGTLNHFARDMGIPADLAAAVTTACTGRIARVDVGRVNGRLFLNNSGLGLYPQAVRRRDASIDRLGRTKWRASLWAAWTVFRRYPFLDVHLTVEGESLEYRTPLVFIGNNSYELDGLNLGVRRSLDAGHLSVHIVDRAGRTGLVVLALRALCGRLREAKDFKTFSAADVEVRTRRRHLSVTTDGEVNRLQAPLNYHLEPLALPVLVPAAQG